MTSTEAVALREENERLRECVAVNGAALEKINQIRNSIIGLGTINWSEHIYPLVAVLNEAGLKGMPYSEASEHYGTALQRAVKAEDRLTTVRAALMELRAEVVFGELLSEAVFLEKLNATIARLGLGAEGK